MQGTEVMSTTVSLNDKYELPKGRVFMTGTQALVRLLMVQKARDEAAGLKTGGFVSGYRGSPLGSVDQELWKAKKLLEKHNVRFNPGLNEELAATSVWGSQMAGMDPKATVDGVFAMWYGKGPGVDRSGDVFKHANIAGTSRFGGVLAIAGDDHTCKSSTLPHQSEQAFIAAAMPVLNPSGVREFLEFGLHGWAMSRYSGCWIGFKAVSETIETTSSFEIDPMAIETRVPDNQQVQPGSLSIRWPDPPMEQEARLLRDKLQAVLEYVRLNALNRQEWKVPNAKLGIVTTGKSYLDTREALSLLGIDEAGAKSLGLRLLKIGMSWPLEPVCVTEFAEGLVEILVVEEKRGVIEPQIKEQLYNAPADSRPRVVGKAEGEGEWVRSPNGFLLPPNGELTPALIAKVIAQRLLQVLGAGALPQSATAVLASAGCAAALDPTLPQRLPFFCSGCPHNTSTKVPEGSRAGAGIGCHGMAILMDRNTGNITQMGGEGAAWIGHAPFTSEGHIFQNLGDGTYSHSGSLALRAAVAAGVNITYKILANDAVAMTGGQPVEGSLTAIQILQQVAAEGVKNLHLVSDDPASWQALGGLPAGVIVSHRDRLDEVQRQLRDSSGVSVIVYAQTCAAEKRRRRKKKEMVDPPRRVVINEEVCEGCGDCGVQSNCVSIVPLETPLGRKRTIDQSSCNKDYSCVKGFCPSFVTVEGGAVRKASKSKNALPADLPQPVIPPLDQPYNVLITGVGGTGVVTIGALMGMAAHIEGKGVVILDMAGLAQKGGAVMSHVRLAAKPDALHGARIGQKQVDLLLACDLMVAASKEALFASGTERTHAVVNTHVAPTGGFTRNLDWQARPEELLEQLKSGVKQTATIDASRLATKLMGDAVATNVFMLGFAWQSGRIPLSEASLLRAIELNGAAVAMNTAAFAWGRQAALELDKVRSAAGMDTAQVMLLPQRTPSLDTVVADRKTRLSGYQNDRYAQHFEARVRELAALEKATLGTDRVAREVATSLYKLMAYKDEYEVARLYTESGFFERIDREFEGNYKLHFHLAPPLLAKRDGNGRLLKKAYGPWVAATFRWLAKGKVLRGTVLDVFGYTAERRSERAEIARYLGQMRQVLSEARPEHTAILLELARLPQTMRGYGHVKEANVTAARRREAYVLEQLRKPVAAKDAQVQDREPQVV
ncbi:indolepyruvate ferredoxin oxidoreductase [Variovorax sp. Root318D1]|uniref:indolepyruvate ferredoxin oxidoreductase family protein n=1 Tax=Variovorax sp. Root318D1 TaxID=1736513 RepID=UPI0006F278BC|nr:indolepyruvate ferredoxin oxidoreductase [Variovorax sp. Root318D1]